MSELTDPKKAAILHDALPHYYIKQTKEANQTPLQVPLEALIAHALNVEESTVNTGTDAKGNSKC
jgi:hypothetical protein